MIGKPLQVVKPYSRSFCRDLTAIVAIPLRRLGVARQGRSIVCPHGPAGTSTASSVPVRTGNSNGSSGRLPVFAAMRTVPRYTPGFASAGTWTVSQKRRVTSLGISTALRGMIKPRRDRVDRALHRHAGEAIGDEAHVDGLGGNRCTCGPRQVARRNGHAAQVAQRRNRDRSPARIRRQTPSPRDCLQSRRERGRSL